VTRAALYQVIHNLMTTKHETLERLHDQMIDDFQAVNKLIDRQTAGEDLTREIDELANAIEVKIAVSRGLRKRWRED